jgi:hypothetical protein
MLLVGSICSLFLQAIIMLQKGQTAAEETGAEETRAEGPTAEIGSIFCKGHFVCMKGVPFTRFICSLCKTMLYKNDEDDNPGLRSQSHD